MKAILLYQSETGSWPALKDLDAVSQTLETMLKAKDIPSHACSKDTLRYFF
jgi:hypothetical protein